jgi:hypothetical protein
MRSSISILIFGALAACADSGLPALPGDQIQTGFPPGGVIDVIQVNAINRLPLRTAELIAPDGQATPASYLTVNPAPSVASYQAFPNRPYPGSGFDVGTITAAAPAAPLTGSAPQQRVTFLKMVANASIPLPDSVEYRREWRSYRIRLTFGTPPGETETQEVAAPEPPPGD